MTRRLVNFFFLANIALFSTNKLPTSVSLSGMFFYILGLGHFGPQRAVPQAKFVPKRLNFILRPNLSQSGSISTNGPIWTKPAQFHPLAQFEPKWLNFITVPIWGNSFKNFSWKGQKGLHSLWRISSFWNYDSNMLWTIFSL